MFTLVPSTFFNPAEEREALAEVVELKDTDTVNHIDIPQYDAVLIYGNMDEDSSVSVPEMAEILGLLPSCREYNKIICSLTGNNLYLAIAQGKNLLLANNFKVQDFTTAEYFIFLAMKSLQLNPEVSTICWKGSLDAEDEMSLYRYFKGVDRI